MRAGGASGLRNVGLFRVQKSPRLMRGPLGTCGARIMRVLVFGNSGSGKTTLARTLAVQHRLIHLDLDSIVWEPGQIAVQRPADAIATSLRQFLSEHEGWVIEGCYGELINLASAHCT